MSRQELRSTGGNCQDRKSTRLNSSHHSISYAVFCLKKKAFGLYRPKRISSRLAEVRDIAKACTVPFLILFSFFFNDTATTEIYTLSLHDALPISGAAAACKATQRTGQAGSAGVRERPDRKSTRLNSSHHSISYAVFCLKTKKDPRRKGGGWVRTPRSCESISGIATE